MLPLRLAASARRRDHNEGSHCGAGRHGRSASPADGAAAARRRRGSQKEGQGRGRLRRHAEAPKRPALGKAAAKLLDELGGDVDAAQAARFDSYMEKLRASDPELFADVARARRCDPAAPARGRDRLLAMTWDTVADYLPVETADAALDARLARVAAFARGRCLDVGCGDGAMVPHLKARAAYCGVDLSARMVSLARRRHPDARFERAGFFEFVAGGEEAAWDTILFVAALQFFPDVDAVLAACAARLAPGGRVVVAHVRGAAFVRQERRGNPAVVEALPAVEDLLAAGGFGLVHAEEDLEDFYLVVLERA